MKTTKCLLLLAGSAVLAAPHLTFAQETYYDLPLTALTLTEGQLPPEERPWPLPEAQPYAALDGPGEVYVLASQIPPWNRGDRPPPSATIHIRAPQGRPVTGRLFVAKPDVSEGFVRLTFKVAPEQAKAGARDTFFAAKEDHYRQLRDLNIPGSAWFRHQAQEAAKNHAVRTNVEPEFAPWNRPRQRASELEDTYDLFTGGRALSENMQLDRVLPPLRTNEESIALTNLTGISVKEMNWKELIKDAKPELDPLASYIPADQHAIFFPTFQAMTAMIDEADANGTPVLQLLEPRAEDADSRTRYQKQLCLGMTEISRLLGPQVVAGVAFTGSDPFLRVGTDVAVVFDARNPELLKGFIAAQQKAAQSVNPAAKPVQGDIQGISYTGMLSPDRAVSSYLASIANVVFVCNSKSQLENLVRVAKGGAPALSSQDEYIFFRNRYPRSDKSETALVILTDATIRRWCGPRWRIADSRRTRAAALMSEMQAAHVTDLVGGKANDAVLPATLQVPDAGEFRLTRGGVVSAAYGSLNFMTPIAEIPLTTVSRAEADAYARWRDGYQRNWRQYFDPIAIRFSVAKEQLAAELTIMPLIASTDYRDFIAFSSGAEIAPNAGDPHTNTLLHLAFAINTASQPVQQAGGFLSRMAPGIKANPFSWLGQSIAIYADEDPFWDRVLQATNSDTFMEKNLPTLPVALHCEVKEPLGLAAFLTAVHAFVDQTAPGMTTWQNQDYNGQPYVKITAKPSDSEDFPKDLAICYAATPRALIITLNEALLKRALDRLSARAATEGKEPKAAPAKFWLGKNICAVVQRKLVDVFQKVTEESEQDHFQSLSWNNLPILNEWKHLFPDRDPLKVHEQLWGTRLLCPGGGTYVWNEKWQTMESTVFGHPGEPRKSSGKALAEIVGAQLGVTFENQGLSGKAVLRRAPAK